MSTLTKFVIPSAVGGEFARLLASENGSLSMQHGVDAALSGPLTDWIEFYRQLGNAIAVAQGVLPKVAA